ncbi:MAG: ribbon-helix-helix protein, CopG family [Betaproteobacteria bacterium]
MSVITLSLPDDLDSKLAHVAELANKPRSELARDAIADYLERLERDRRLAHMEAAVRALAADPESLSEALQISESFLPSENEALAAFERSAEYKASRISKAQKKGKR